MVPWGLGGHFEQLLFSNPSYNPSKTVSRRGGPRSLPDGSVEDGWGS